MTIPTPVSRARRLLQAATTILGGALLVAACATTPAADTCPPPRAAAPTFLDARTNPLSEADYDRRRARRIFETNDGAGCIACHGRKGDGRGPIAARLTPAPRDFTCRAAMAATSDGQLFRAIRHGVPGTPMLSHPELSDEETWQVVRYIREFAR